MRSIVLACSLLLAMALAGNISANNHSKAATLHFLDIHQVSGPLGSMRRNTVQPYDLAVRNFRSVKLAQMQVDVTLPNQTIDPRSIKLVMPRGMKIIQQLIGKHHLRLMLKNFPSLQGGQIYLNARVDSNAPAMVRNKLTLVVGGKLGDYSPDPLSVKGGV